MCDVSYFRRVHNDRITPVSISPVRFSYSADFGPSCVISDDSQWAIVCALLMLLINFLVQVTLRNNRSTLSNKKSSLKCFLHYSRLKSAVLNFRNIGLCYHTRRRRHGDRTRLKAKSRFQVNSCGSNRIKECMILWQSILNHN